MLRRTLTRIVTAGVLSMPALVHAEQVTVHVDATVTSVQDSAWALGGAVQPGTRISGTYVFETTTADIDQNPDFAHYPHDPGTGGFDLAVGGISFKTDPTSPAGMFTIDMGNMPGGADYHVVSVDNLVPLPSGGHVYHVSLDLASWDGTSPLSSTALSSTLPDPNLFQERSIYISGALGGAYFQIMAQLDSMQTVSGVASRPGLYTVDARIVEVYDPSWTLQGILNPGDPINGTYQLDPGVQDRDPYPETAWYEHALMEGYGFSLTAGGRTFVTDSSTYPVNVFVQDNGGFDVYEVSNYGGTAGPDLRVNDIFMHLGDPSGQALSSTDLIQTPEVSRFMGPKDLMITGSRPDGSGYFHIRAEVLSIGVGGEPASALTLLPGDTQLLPGQGIDLGILLKPGYKPSSGPGMPLTVRVNGYRRDDILYGCHPFGGTDETGYFSICRDAELLLDPALPESRITIDVLMDDNTSQSGTITWELLKP